MQPTPGEIRDRKKNTPPLQILFYTFFPLERDIAAFLEIPLPPFSPPTLASTGRQHHASPSRAPFFWFSVITDAFTTITKDGYTPTSLMTTSVSKTSISDLTSGSCSKTGRSSCPRISDASRRLGGRLSPAPARALFTMTACISQHATGRPRLPQDTGCRQTMADDGTRDDSNPKRGGRGSLQGKEVGHWETRLLDRMGSRRCPTFPD